MRTGQDHNSISSAQRSAEVRSLIDLSRIGTGPLGQEVVTERLFQMMQHYRGRPNPDTPERVAFEGQLQTLMPTDSIKVGSALITPLSVLDGGTDGLVLIARRECGNQKPTEVVMKVSLPFKTHPNGTTESKDNSAGLRWHNEVAALQRLAGTGVNVPQFLEATLLQPSKRDDRPNSIGVIVMERLRGTELDRHIERIVENKGPIGEIARAWGMRLELLSRLAEHGVVPFDFTGFNMNVELASNSNRITKLTTYDFGKCRLADSHEGMSELFAESLGKMMDIESCWLDPTMIGVRFPDAPDFKKLIISVRAELLALAAEEQNVSETIENLYEMSEMPEFSAAEQKTLATK